MPYHGGTMTKTMVAIAACIYALTAVASADSGPAYTGAASASEAAFVRDVQSDLEARFPTAARCGQGGVRPLHERRRYRSDQLRELAVAVRRSAPPEPTLVRQERQTARRGFFATQDGVRAASSLGINPGRWSEFDGHVHWVGKDPATGALTYDHWVMQPAWVAAGGSVQNPSAATLVKLGKVSSPADVATIFFFPTLWDLIVWVKPNPNGAFADKNPTVTP